MPIDTGATQSIWMKESKRFSTSPLLFNEKVDVCVVGAGIAGLSVAYQAIKEGLSIVVLDDGPVGGGQTMRTSAHLASALDDNFHSLESRRGLERSRAAYESHADAISRIESIVRTEGIDCDFRRVDGFLFAHDGSTGELEQELAAAHRAGFEEAEFIPAAPLPGGEAVAAIRFPRQAEFNPLRYLDGLAAAITAMGGRIFTNTRVEVIEGGTGSHVRTATGQGVFAKHIVVATNSPVNDRFVIHTKQAPYITYCIALRIPRNTVAHALYWDTQDPYHYVRVTEDEAAQFDSENRPATELLIVGGEDHKTGQADDAEERYARLEAWARERFPMAMDVAARWCGQVLETLDGLAYIGRNPADADNVYIATGDSGMGLTHGVIAGTIITDLILGRENPWIDAYAPNRLPVGGIDDFLRENVNVAAQYIDWFRPGEVSDPIEIGRGEGAIIRKGASLIAAYREATGQLRELSAVCPHLQGIVRWNSDDKTWDCPCHGSRFTPEGRVIQGPSLHDLPPARTSSGRVLERPHHDYPDPA